jgi:RNA polymerase sigma factor (sigma-70 family)
MEQASPLSTVPSDAAIIAASRDEPMLFSTVFDRHFAAVHRYLARRVGRQVADDLAASTFVVALERRASFHPAALGARPWLYGIATNLLRSHLRDERRRIEADVAMRTNGFHPLGAIASAGLADSLDDGSALEAALAGLDADQRDVLLLYAWAELSYEEIASSLAIPIGTVRSRLARARARLRSSLRQPPPSTALAAPTTDQEER